MRYLILLLLLSCSKEHSTECRYKVTGKIHSGKGYVLKLNKQALAIVDSVTYNNIKTGDCYE